MSAIQLEIGENEFAQLRECADKDRLSVEEFVRRAALDAVDGRRWQFEYLRERAKGADWKKFKAVMAKVPDVPPVPGDELPEGWENKH